MKPLPLDLNFPKLQGFVQNETQSHRVGIIQVSQDPCSKAGIEGMGMHEMDQSSLAKLCISMRQGTSLNTRHHH